VPRKVRLLRVRRHKSSFLAILSPILMSNPVDMAWAIVYLKGSQRGVQTQLELGADMTGYK